jgi:hypothetical protein
MRQYMEVSRECQHSGVWIWTGLWLKYDFLGELDV